jgi:hypothetical protein
LVGVLAFALTSVPLEVEALFAPASVHRALFHLDEGSGTATADAKSGANACLGITIANPCPTADASSPAWTTDARYGSALRFDGKDDTVTFEHSASLSWASTDDQVIVEAWIKPAGEGTILSKGWSGNHNYRVGIDPSGNLVFSYTDKKGRLRQVASPLGSGQGAPVSFNQWHWVSVRFSHNSNSITMIVDGGRNDTAGFVFKGGGLTAPDPRTNTLPLSIGSFGGGPPFFQGLIDEVRFSIKPDGAGGYPIVGSDRGVVISRVEFAPASGDEFIELFRPNFGDGAGPLLLTSVYVYDGAVLGGGNVYTVPSNGTRCINDNLSCYEVSPGETVRIWLNGAGPAIDTASTTFSEWFTSNCNDPSCTLGDGGAGQDLGAVDLIRIRTSGKPQDPGTPLYLMHADIVVWGGDQSTNGDVFIMVNLEGLWPAVTAFVSTTPTTTGIQLIKPGDNLKGPAAWQAIP